MQPAQAAFRADFSASKLVRFPYSKARKALRLSRVDRQTTSFRLSRQRAETEASAREELIVRAPVEQFDRQTAESVVVKAQLVSERQRRKRFLKTGMPGTKSSVRFTVVDWMTLFRVKSQPRKTAPETA
ncbi:MAG: hypothetical protein ACLU9S_21235 [Oscillospiraceae bacterium]